MEHARSMNSPHDHQQPSRRRRSYRNRNKRGRRTFQRPLPLHQHQHLPNFDWNSYSQTHTSSAPYAPHLFGHPHEETPPDITDPFWHQYPSWCQPGKSVYFYPGLGYTQRPIYLSQTMDGRPVVIGYGPKSVFSKQLAASSSNAPVRRPPRHVVDVHTANELVQRISLKTLVRFSTLASDALPRMKPREQELASSPTSPPGDNHAAEDVAKLSFNGSKGADSNTDWSEGEGRSSNYASSQATSRAPTASTQITDYSDSPPPPAKKRRSLGRAVVENSTAMVKKLTLNLDVWWEPTTEAVKYALDWMKDNSKIPGDGKLMAYGPTRPEDIDFVDLVDVYAAAVLLDLRPFPRQLRQEIMDRISTLSPIDFETFECVIGHLPAEDPVITRAINQLYYGRVKHQHSQEQLDEFDEFLDDESNRQYKIKVEQNAAYHKQVEESRRQQRGPHSREAFWNRRSETTTSPPMAEIQVSSEGEASTEDVDQPRGRRRNRRQQQARGNGKGKDGAHVIGADD